MDNRNITKSSNKRIAWIDMAKGLGILFVVIGHIKTCQIVHDAIFLFHMPLFFLLSGIVFKVNEEWSPCMRKKVVHLLLPYFFFMILFVPIRYATDTICTGISPAMCLQMLGLSYFDKPLWFIFALFIVIAVMRTLISFIHQRWIIFTAVFILGGIGYLLLDKKIEMPFHLSRALFVLPFFAIGICLQNKKYFRTIWMFVFGIGAFVFGLYGLLQGHISLDTLKMHIDPDPLYVYIPAIGGSLIILSVLKYVDSIKQQIGGVKQSCNVLSYLGRNSFYIFAAHHPFILFVNSIFYRELEEPYFSLPYAVMLTVASVMFSLSIGFALKRIVPCIFK